MKRIIIVLLLALAFASTQAATTLFTVNNIQYSVLNTENNTVQVEGIDDNTITDLIIPGTVEYNNTTYHVTTIKNFAFDGNKTLKTVVVSEGVTTIGRSAFGRCTSLESISLPETLTSLDISDLSVFRECSSLKSIIVAEGNTHFRVDECGVLYDYDMKNLIYCPPAIEKSKVVANYIVPSTVENICNYAFNFNPFTHIVLPSYLKTIGEDAFANASDVNPKHPLKQELTIPASVTKIGSGAFYNSDITSIFYLWDGKTSLPTAKNIDLRKDATIYVKKSVYNNHLNDLKAWISTTYQYKVPINATKTYTTLCRDFDVDLSNAETSSGIKAYYASSVNKDKVTLKEIDYVPSRNGANHDEYTGVIIKVDEPNKTYYYQIGEKDYTSDNQEPNLSGNLLVGVPTETYIYGQPENYMCYGLYSGEFRRYSNDDFLQYNKAYLRLLKSSAGAKMLSIYIDKTPTGISEMKQTTDSYAPYYTLDGIPLGNKPTHPGIYIHGGKKVMLNK